MMSSDRPSVFQKISKCLSRKRCTNKASPPNWTEATVTSWCAPDNRRSRFASFRGPRETVLRLDEIVALNGVHGFASEKEAAPNMASGAALFRTIAVDFSLPSGQWFASCRNSPGTQARPVFHLFLGAVPRTDRARCRHRSGPRSPGKWHSARDQSPDASSG